MKHILCPYCRKSALLETYYTTYKIMFPFYLCPKCGRTYDAQCSFKGHNLNKVVPMGTGRTNLETYMVRVGSNVARLSTLEFPTKEFFDTYAGTDAIYAPWY